VNKKCSTFVLCTPPMMHGHSNSQVVSGPVGSELRHGLVVVAKQICSTDTLRRAGVDDERSKRRLVGACTV